MTQTSTDTYTEARAWYEANWDPQLPLGDWWRTLADSGWAFPRWPEGGGGRGLSGRDAKEALRARRDVGAYGPPNGVATFLTAPTLLTYGTEDQKRRFMPGIVDGRDIWCQLFSEPGSGSDMASLATRAERDGDEWIVNGQKVWNSGAQYARYGILIARTDPEQPKHRGITFFLIDMEQDGVEVRPLREMTGDAAFNEVFINNARIPDSDRLGDLGDGWRVAMTTLSHERDPDNDGVGEGGFIGTFDLTASVADHKTSQKEAMDGFSIAISGAASGLLDSVVKQFGATDDPVRRQRLMKILTMRRNSRWSGQRTAARVKAGGQPGPEVSTLKVLGSEIGRQMRDTGLDAMGPHGMLWGDDAPERGLFHSFAMFTPSQSIAGGTDEVNRNIMGERVHGLPREPGETELRNTPWNELRRS